MLIMCRFNIEVCLILFVTFETIDVSFQIEVDKPTLIIYSCQFLTALLKLNPPLNYLNAV